MIIKNGIRIAVLTILAIRVDPSFLFGRLHRDGGVVFFLIGLALLVPILWLLASSEGRELRRDGRSLKNPINMRWKSLVVFERGDYFFSAL